MPNLDDIVTGDHTPRKRVQSKHLRQNMTPAEAAIWRHVRANRLGGHHFRRQQVIDGYIVDFYCHAAGVVVELDGDVHAFQRDEDAARQQALQRRGLRVLRYTNREVASSLSDVLNDILRVADKRVGERRPTPGPAGRPLPEGRG